MKNRSIPKHVLDAVALVNNYMIHNNVHEIKMFDIWITTIAKRLGCHAKRPSKSK